ncbi:sigma-70 family RNA polymerase sigma factor [Oceanobacillus kapialis]|uniref:sigma-70 family RNA polymerase sigma factor n=1 Tax=Oceanobacillus kapialis TaxID=481353 RepID=UPI00384DE347
MEDLTVDLLEIQDKEQLLDELMHCYGQQILQLTYSYVHSKEVAEDLTQDIFVKCYKSFHTFNGGSMIRTWLWRIAINHCKDYLRSLYNKKVVVSENDLTYIGGRQESVEQTIMRKDEDHHLSSTVMQLPIKYREVIYLFYFEELQIKEISLVLEVKESTVKTRLKRAKEILKKVLGE